MEELGKVKSNNVSFEMKAKSIYSLVFPITMYGCESWTGKKAIGKKLIRLKYGVGGELYRYPGPRERQTSESQSQLSLKHRWSQK